MARFTRDDGMRTLSFSAWRLLRMRVSMSAIGSVIIVKYLLPARLEHAGHFALHHEFAQLAAPQPEFFVHTARAPGQGAARTLARARRIPRHFLKRDHCLVALLLGEPDVLDLGTQLGTLGGVLGGELLATLVALDH